MGLISKAVAIGFGYVLGRPEARQKLVDLAQHPKVKQLRDQGQNLATDRLQAAKHRLNRRGDTGSDELHTPETASPPPSALAEMQEGVLPPAQVAAGSRGQGDSEPAVSGLRPLPGPVPPTSPTDTP